jgi:hypothetical protein
MGLTTRALHHERLHQLQRLLPQQLFLLLIVSVGRITRLIRYGVWIDYLGNPTLFEIFSALTFQSLRGSCPNRRCSTLLRALERLADVWILVPRLHHVLVDMRHEASEYQSGMDGPCVDTMVSVSTVELGRSVHVGCLALAISCPRMVLSFEIEVIQMDATHAMADGRKHDNPRFELWSARFDQSGKKKLDQQEVSQVIRAELHFKAIHRASFGACHYTCVGNEDVEATVMGQE